MGQLEPNAAAMQVEDFLADMPHMYDGDDLRAVREMIGLEADE